MRESSPKGRSVRPRPFLFSPLFTGVRGETVWKIAEGVTSAILWRQEATDRDSLDSSRPLSEPRFGTHSDFPNSFGRGILRSSSLEGSRNSSSSQEPRYFGQAFLTRPPPAHSRLRHRQPCQRRRCQCLGRNSPCP